MAILFVIPPIALIGLIVLVLWSFAASIAIFLRYDGLAAEPAVAAAAA